PPEAVPVDLTTKDGIVLVNGKDATAFTVNTTEGNTVVSTELGAADLKAGTTLTHIAAGATGKAGQTQATRADDDDHKLSGGALFALLAATAGAVVAIIYATTHNNDLNFGGTVNVVRPPQQQIMT